MSCCLALRLKDISVDKVDIAFLSWTKYKMMACEYDGL